MGINDGQDIGPEHWLVDNRRLSMDRYKGKPVTLIVVTAAAILINIGGMALVVTVCVAVPYALQWLVGALAHNMGVVG
jgi:hypothetical protein